MLVGYDGVERVKQLAESAKKRFGAEIGYADGSSEAANGSARCRCRDRALRGGPACGAVDHRAARQGPEAAGRGRRQCRAALEHRGGRGQDDGKPIPGTQALGIGALAIGNVKYKVQAGLFRA